MWLKTVVLTTNPSQKSLCHCLQSWSMALKCLKMHRLGKWSTTANGGVIKFFFKPQEVTNERSQSSAFTCISNIWISNSSFVSYSSYLFLCPLMWTYSQALQHNLPNRFGSQPSILSSYLIQRYQDLNILCHQDLNIFDLVEAEVNLDSIFRIL